MVRDPVPSGKLALARHFDVSYAPWAEGAAAAITDSLTDPAPLRTPLIRPVEERRVHGAGRPVLVRADTPAEPTH